MWSLFNTLQKRYVLCKNKKKKKNIDTWRYKYRKKIDEHTRAHELKNDEEKTAMSQNNN